MEIWKKVEDFENYEISNLGRLKSNLKFRKYRNYQSKILKPSKDKDGYYRTILSNNGVRKNKTIHRLVAIAFLENKENYPVVNHKNGIKDEDVVENLEWCTILYNNIHAIKLGLKKPLKRENHNFAKLKEKDIIEIRENKDKLFQWQLGLIYGVGQTQISRIINLKRWKS